MKYVSKIPIKNIYYMLCYAWYVLEQSNNIFVGSEKFNNIYDLFAKIYINGTKSIIKKGLNRYYINENEEMCRIKGKVNVNDSIKRRSIFYRKMVCHYDEFSENTKLNQIVKATIEILLKYDKLNDDLKNKLLSLRRYFINIGDIKLSKRLFSSLRYNRNNYNYKMLINISELIYDGMLINETDNMFLLSDFVKDRKMANLYEKFVLNFYKCHLDNNVYKVYAPELKWNISGDITEESMALLPKMRTDIVIENKNDKNQLIIDTKFYSKTLIASNWSDIEKVRNNHLYQILAYVNSSKFNGDIRGMLLYPTIEREVNSKFCIDGKDISINTLNLNTEWSNIEQRLLDIII
ncbi:MULTISPECIES: 5-methylcytosine-specific restriction endonuclease system specificity protein McrC [Clostridium]|uniref:5-methylcytosine-specific restriction endonuclease system specificity protein McrC n=1 Tax=Clostridium TaxID=1485 RepID=UPI0004D5DBCD|nr:MULTISPECIES: 5-methylcytosine-specific restriction endonuclease system specificity protein McrC [Clostridium]KEH85272.1 hypothetical protein Z967_09100 [Clostridium novyi A str. 4540]KEH92322.1 hypothetical protein Z963_06315 [Clostridium botulinum C/D str. It1]